MAHSADDYREALTAARLQAARSERERDEARAIARQLVKAWRHGAIADKQDALAAFDALPWAKGN